MTKLKKVCPHCGAGMMEHRHNFSKAMAEGLHRLASKQVAINIKYLGLTRNQWDNFQKLRYWGLVRKHYDVEGNRVGGCWEVTEKGYEFLKGKISIPRVVWTFRGEFIREEPARKVMINSILDDYKTRPEYAQESLPHI